MDRLRDIQVFIEVAQGRSFTAAAHRLSMSRASVTKHISALESLLGARLLSRSTQHVGLTEAGIAVLNQGARLLRAFEDLETEVKEKTREPRGVIRVGVPTSYGAFHLIPAVAAFQRKHTDVTISLYSDAGDLNLIKEGLDVSLRIATSLKNTSYISRLLARAPQVLVASPLYLARRGGPATPAELAKHNCLIHTLKSPTDVWKFRTGGVKSVQVGGSIKSNFGEALRHAALLGLGISMHPTYMVDDDIKAGRLKIVLPSCEPVGLEIRAIYPQKQNLPARVRVFLDFLKHWLPAESTWLEASSRRTANG